ncbi:hypothetical protein ACOME3_003645 [Neoechinorhynchus agilis]
MLRNVGRRSAHYTRLTQKRLQSVRGSIEQLRDNWRSERAYLLQTVQTDRVLKSIEYLHTLCEELHKMRIALDLRTRRLENIGTGLVDISQGIRGIITDLKTIERGVSLSWLRCGFGKKEVIRYQRQFRVEPVDNEHSTPADRGTAFQSKQENEMKNFTEREIDLVQNANEVDVLLDRILGIYEAIKCGSLPRKRSALEARMNETISMVIRSLQLVEKNERLTERLNEASLSHRTSTTAIRRLFSGPNPMHYGLRGTIGRLFRRNTAHFDQK